MDIMKVFKMPKPVSIMARTSSITNAFVNGIIPCIMPSENEVREALNLLDLNAEDLRCVYCGDKATEWDYLRPLVKNKRPTGYISEIYNLVPACGKCNQSKGNKDWREWMMSDAKLSPKTRNISDMEKKIERLNCYEKWKDIKPIDFEGIVGKEAWEKHWENCERLHKLMEEFQEHSDLVKDFIAREHKS